ncbi:Phosphatidylethanolamine N-methyltransferase [Talaromyces atroroseus]|uniref:Phosphatidylethanolamine N-methyltransferase n=1 Tax=Talaromyces atroroseus TaxID=1441469 RepID=A0A225ARM9_TALAT|nr:Phosphatidylethanolamine N-methyltransferase [Talaromyces atroroseus]OKL64241.1 Phosphatidylethanolamine N-methyltransferase [Talaromyces atroroseus]
MDSLSATGAQRQNDEGLRERVRPSQPIDVHAVDQALASAGYGVTADVKKSDDDKKTFGRTPDGTVFTVPLTHDMVSQLLSPTQPKNLSDVVVLAILASHLLIFAFLAPEVRIPVFAAIYMFWRTSYNGGIGWLLHNQSHHNTLVRWATKSQIFVNPSTGKNPHPRLYELLKRDMETMIPKDYSFDNAPLEYNTWLVFRRVVDVILMCDFTSYCLFAIACGTRPENETALMTGLRWAAGWVLVLFNLWVKLDAHRVVKDFAWYWGDFFFLIDQELTFDGVFEMAPHPMYSVGYAGYYGISLMAASYKVLFISIVAHAAQFAFLVFVENPHIDRIYNPPAPRKRSVQLDNSSIALNSQTSPISDSFPAPASIGIDDKAATQQPSSVHNLLGLHNLDFHRVTDSSVILVQLLVLAITSLTPSTPTYQYLFVANAALWRCWYSIGMGYILHRQSKFKSWTRHFVKYGENTDEAWRQWKGSYHLSMTMCYASFIAATWKMYSVPSDWNHGLALLKHTLGISLIVLQVWTSVSIYDSLGEFGWFFGDFFFDAKSKLTYSGIYRFLNNPERVLGLAGLWGAALITSKGAIIFLALLSHVLTLAFIQMVERPHMQKLYGRSLRQDAGLVKSLKRSLPPPLQQLGGSVDRMMDESFEFVEELLDSARPKLATGVNTFMKDAKSLFRQYPARITISRLDDEVAAGYDLEDYSLEIEGTESSPSAQVERSSGKEGAHARAPPERRGDLKNLIFEYGAPIKVKWTASLNHSKKDWIGLYMVTDNTRREVTRISSQGRWIATNEGSYDSLTCEKGLVSSDIVISASRRSDGVNRDLASGEMVFSGDKLFWTQGVFEFRYHHNGKHNVMAISRPFEIRIGRFDEEEVVDVDKTSANSDALIQSAIEQALLPVARNCFDRDPEIAPETYDEHFGSLVDRDGKYAKRVVFAVHQMFGVELAPEVVRADGNVRNMAWRICNAKKVLAPYSMSRSRGTSTPTTQEEQDS